MTISHLRPLSLKLCVVFTCIGLGLVLLSVQPKAADTPNTTQASASQNATQRTYAEVVLDRKHSDPKAVEIAKKLMADDMDMMEQFNKRPAKVSATFVALKPNGPKNAIVAQFEHISVCGSMGCQVVVFIPTDKNKYRSVFNYTIGRVFLNLRAGRDMYDILTMDGTHRDGFGVFFWNQDKKEYGFAGISKFKK